VNILQLVHTLDPRGGGVAPAVLALSAGLGKLGHRIEIATLDDSNRSDPPRASLFPIHALGPGITSYRYSKKLLPWLRAHRREFDRVIVHGLWQYHGFAAWRVLAGSAVPYFIFPHGMLDPWFKRTFPLKHLKKWFYWPWAEYRVLRDAAAVIFTAEEERLQARKSFWLYRCRERISPLGLEAPPSSSSNAKTKFIAAYPQLQNSRILLFLGRLHPKKGCDVLIDAFAQVAERNLSLVLAGPDQTGWQRELQQKIASYGLSQRIVFSGMLEGEMKHGALAAADAFVLPSHQENFGMSVIEALAAGLPVLISNRVNIWREIDIDRAGLIENDDVSGTKRLLERWLQTPPEQRELMRANARYCFVRRFQLDHSVASLVQILEEPLPAR
jgi:glycosyltransferase involved in cell wall biosynthesis